MRKTTINIGTATAKGSNPTAIQFLPEGERTNSASAIVENVLDRTQSNGSVNIININSAIGGNAFVGAAENFLEDKLEWLPNFIKTGIGNSALHEEQQRQILLEINSALGQCYQTNITMPYLLQDASVEQTLYDCYIPLTLISREKQKKYEDQLLKEKRRYNDADFFFTHPLSPLRIVENEVRSQQDPPIELNKLWQAASYLKTSLPARWVIRGAAGMGKTTLLRCIAAHWALKEEESIHHKTHINLSSWHKCFDMLVHLPLRELLNYTFNNSSFSIRNDLSLETRLLAGFLEKLYPKLKPQQILWLAEHLLSKEEASPRILLLLDGLDEVNALLEEFILPPNLKPKEEEKAQYHHNYRQQLLKSLLMHQHWLLTTRPHLAEHPCLCSASTYHLGLTGFSSQHITAYVTNYYRAFAPQRDIQPILTWLTQPDLSDLTQVPLQLELLCYLTSKMKDFYSLEEGLSLTRLYAELFQALAKRFLEKNPAFLKQKINPKTLNGKQALLRCEEPLRCLSEFALEMMLSEATVGSFESVLAQTAFGKALDQDLEQKEALFEAAFARFGVLNSYDSTEHELDKKLYYFHHLTYQEFLAAWALARRLLSEDKAKRNSSIQEIQDSFYQRMEFFLVSLLSQPDLAEFFLPTSLSTERQNIVDDLLYKAIELVPWDMDRWNEDRWGRSRMDKENAIKHLFHLLDASLLPVDAGHKALLPSQKKAFEKAIDLIRNHSFSYYSNESKISYFTRRFLQEDKIKIFLDNKWNGVVKKIDQRGSHLPSPILGINYVSLDTKWEHHEKKDIMEWIDCLECPLPAYIEQYLEETARRSLDPIHRALAIKIIGGRGSRVSSTLQLALADLLWDRQERVQVAAVAAILRLGENATELQRPDIHCRIIEIQDKQRQTPVRIPELQYEEFYACEVQSEYEFFREKAWVNDKERNTQIGSLPQRQEVNPYLDLFSRDKEKNKKKDADTQVMFLPQNKEQVKTQIQEFGFFASEGIDDETEFFTHFSKSNSNH